MREHMGLFRGKRVDNGEWVEGFYYRVTNNWTHENVHYITCFQDMPLTGETILTVQYEVDPTTIGECTSLKDKNGKLIFEGDRVRYPDGIGLAIDYDTINEGIVDWDEEVMCFYFTERWLIGMEEFEVIDGRMIDVEIIGNIHDNGDLLKGGEGDG